MSQKQTIENITVLNPNNLNTFKIKFTLMKLQYVKEDETSVHIQFDSAGAYVYSKYPNGTTAEIDIADYCKIGMLIGYVASAQRHEVDIPSNVGELERMAEEATCYADKLTKGMNVIWTLPKGWENWNQNTFNLYLKKKWMKDGQESTE